MLAGRVLLARQTQRLAFSTVHRASSTAVAPAFLRHGAKHGSFVRGVQVHMFSTDKEDRKDLPPLQTVEELIAENEALKKELAELKEQASKVKPGLMGTIKQYGAPFLVWWTGLYFATGVGFYYAFDLGLLDGAQVIDFIMNIGLDRLIDPARLDPKHGNLALAIIVNEAVEPLRFPLALATIPYVKKAFSRKEVTPPSN
ncbi:hypothetical protein Poli38472_008571 [Pythium oligandrum]|uniref:DUF1279 domain-containing protein n=1 Tax=Pythium oligandrum TaxID=41045 RepID=A0A8K1C3T5_PYTOL|nr:hypothetical protein Poli38472_008571 [Pythium oligandrum]|eukprot:TMW55923.1 hypothetical protein Poli38472_008571 [Pythium oligandrum]